MKTVLITGCSSGFGLEIARQFPGPRLAGRRDDAHAARGRAAAVG